MPEAHSVRRQPSPTASARRFTMAVNEEGRPLRCAGTLVKTARVVPHRSPTPSNLASRSVRFAVEIGGERRSLRRGVLRGVPAPCLLLAHSPLSTEVTGGQQALFILPCGLLDLPIVANHGLCPRYNSCFAIF